MPDLNTTHKFYSTNNKKLLLKNASIITMRPSHPKLEIIKDGAIVIEDNLIKYIGPQAALDIHKKYDEIVDLAHKWVTPGLIDCHTHIIYGGNRAKEFEMRLEGASYEEISLAGGGINSTVMQTRKLNADALLLEALPRVDHLIREGVTTIEIKSGYGLEKDSELAMLRAAKKLAACRPINVATTCLAAHAIPPEYKDQADRYIDEVVLPTIKAAKNESLAQVIDGFCEKLAFTPAQIDKIFNYATNLGFKVKLHAEQLSNLGGAKLAASYNALSADHLEYLDEAGVKAMAMSGSVAVLLPGAFYAIQEKQLPPIDLLRKYQVKIALSTDSNPGTSPLTSLLLTMNMGATLFKLTVAECLKAVTYNAACALGVQDICGSLEMGKRADLAIWDIKEPAELVYRIGFNPLYARYFSG